MHRLTLLTKFAVVSFVLMTVMGVALVATLGDVARSRAIDDAERLGAATVRVGIQPLLTPDDLQRDFVPLTPERVAQIDASLKPSISQDTFVRVKVWNRQHWIVWSDNPKLVGRWFPGDIQTEIAFGGEISSEITDLSAPDELEERDFGELLAVYVPLRADNGEFIDSLSAPVVGAFEIYLPYEPIAAAIERDRIRLGSLVLVGLVLLYLALFRLVHSASRRLRRQADENRHQALHDALTGLPNRTLYSDRVTTAIRAGRRVGTDAGVVLIDLDGFKEINDTFGHEFGDRLLQEVGRRLETIARSSDTIARFGGDEFAVLAPNIEGEAGARAFVARLLAALDEPIPIGDLELDIRASVGISLFPDHGDTADLLLQRADVAMYVAKEAHSTCEIYSAEIDHYSPERLALAAELRRAIAENELVLHYQPKIALATGDVTGFEALVRWQHPERGMLFPDTFLPVVESTELIGPLTMAVLHQALEQLSRWRTDGHDLTVAVNLSARNLLDLELPDQVAAMLVQYDLPAAAIELELTESALLANPERAKSVLERLADLGIAIAIDDFGTGYASLAYIRELPVSSLKIDRSFVMRMETAQQDAVIVDFSVNLGHSLGLEVVAEGVETELALVSLTGLHCDYAQGYHIGRPMPCTAVADWVISHRAAATATATLAATVSPS